MKSAKELPKYSAGKFLKKNQEYLEAQLLYAAIRLGLFRYLSSPISAARIAQTTGYHERNLELVLNALTAAEFLVKERGTYCSKPETDLYLNEDSEYYLGDGILYWKNAMELEGVEELVRNGSRSSDTRDSSGSDAYDFIGMARAAKNQMYTGRVQAFIQALEEFFKSDKEFKAIDLGGGSGIMAVETAVNFPKASVYVFDQPQVIEFTKDVIEEYGLPDRVKTVKGNFITDEIGSGYDLVIASGIFDFMGNPERMLSRIFESMNSGGILYADTHKVNEDYTFPRNCIIGWLSSHLRGLDILQTDKEIRKAVFGAGFLERKSAKEHEYSGYIFQKP